MDAGPAEWVGTAHRRSSSVFHTGASTGAKGHEPEGMSAAPGQVNTPTSRVFWRRPSYSLHPPATSTSTATLSVFSAPTGTKDGPPRRYRHKPARLPTFPRVRYRLSAVRYW